MKSKRGLDWLTERTNQKFLSIEVGFPTYQRRDVIRKDPGRLLEDGRPFQSKRARTQIPSSFTSRKPFIALDVCHTLQSSLVGHVSAVSCEMGSEKALIGSLVTLITSETQSISHQGLPISSLLRHIAKSSHCTFKNWRMLLLWTGDFASSIHVICNEAET